MLDDFENVHPSNIDAMDSIDAMLFSGDSMFTNQNIKTFNKLLVRWQEQISSIQNTVIEIEREEAITNYIGNSVTVSKDGMTNGSHGIVAKYDHKVKKFVIDFGNGFIGWYTFDELKRS